MLASQRELWKDWSCQLQFPLLSQSFSRRKCISCRADYSKLWVAPLLRCSRHDEARRGITECFSASKHDFHVPLKGHASSMAPSLKQMLKIYFITGWYTLEATYNTTNRVPGNNIYVVLVPCLLDSAGIHVAAGRRTTPSLILESRVQCEQQAYMTPICKELHTLESTQMRLLFDACEWWVPTQYPTTKGSWSIRVSSHTLSSTTPF